MKRNGFTIIEMLVVVVVIAILAGIVFKLIGAGGASADKARARQQLELLSFAIEEYRAEYGKYPPVSVDSSGKQPVMYEYPGSIDYWTAGGKSGSENLANLLNGVPRDQATVFTFGLMSYLECRVSGRAVHAHRKLFEKNKDVSVNNSHWLCENRRNVRSDAKSGDWNDAADNPRDVRMAKRIEPYIEKIRSEGHLVARSYGNECWTNVMSTVIDPWDHQLNYESNPPYDSYRIWSNGPDGKSGTSDDLIAGREN